MAVYRPTLFNLINCIVGVSILAVPFCFHQCGIVLASLTLLVMGFFTKKTCSFLLVSGQLARRRSYESLAQYTYGNGGKIAVEACIIGLMAGTLCAFNVIIGDLAPSIFHNLFGLEPTPNLRAIVMIFMAYGIGLPLSLMRDISSLSSLSALSLLFYSSFVAQIIFSSVPHLLDGSWWKHMNFWRPAGLFQCLPIFSLAFSCQTQLFGLYDSIPDPSVKKMESVINVGFKIVSAVYLFVGFFGYLTFYDVGVKGDVLTNYGDTFIAQCLKTGFMMSVIVSFPLMVFPMRASINSLLFPSQMAGTENMPGGPGYMPQNRFVYITVAVITMTLTVGILIPEIEFVLGITGATIGTLVVLILPAAMFLYTVEETHNEPKIVAKAVVVVGLVCLVASTYSVLTAEEAHHNKPVVHPPVNINIGMPNLTGQVGPIKAMPTIAEDPNNTKLQLATQPPSIGPRDIKTQAAAVEKDTEVKKEEDSESKRKEPVLPHPPDKEGLEDGVLEKKAADPVNEKRQLMSADETKPARNDDKKALDKPATSSLQAQRNVEVTDKEIEHEIKKLEKKKTQVEADLKDLHNFKNVKVTDSRERRHVDENPAAEMKAKGNAGNEQGADVVSSKRSAVLSTSTLENFEESQPNSTAPSKPSIVIEPRKTSPLRGDNATGYLVKGRGLKSKSITGRRLQSEQPLINDRDKRAKRTVWEKRFKQRRIAVKKRMENGLS